MLYTLLFLQCKLFSVYLSVLLFACLSGWLTVCVCKSSACLADCLLVCLSDFLCVYFASVLEVTEITVISKNPFVYHNRQSEVGTR
jgi:hypothetical protein